MGEAMTGCAAMPSVWGEARRVQAVQINKENNKWKQA
jgi:hypothetical protein